MKRIILVSLILTLVTALALPAFVSDQKAEAWSSGKPSIECDTTMLVFNIMDGEVSPETQTIKIRNDGGRILSWKLKEYASWLSVTPIYGSSSGGWKTVEVSANAKDLPMYTTEMATLTIDALNWGVPSETVQVTLNVIPPRKMGPTLAGFFLPEICSDLEVDEDNGGVLEFEGLNAYLINGKEVYHCPIFDLNQMSIAGTVGFDIEYGPKTEVGTFSAVDKQNNIIGAGTYEYCDLTGGSIEGYGKELKQYWYIPNSDILEDYYCTDGEWIDAGLDADGAIVGGKLIKWNSVKLDGETGPMMLGGGTGVDGQDNWILTVYIETDGPDRNDGEPGDMTYKGWIVEDFSSWLSGMTNDLPSLNFNPIMWEDASIGPLGEFMARLPELTNLIGRFLSLDDEEITLTVGPIFDLLRPMMPYIPDLLPTILPAAENLLGVIISDMPVLLVLQPANTPCPFVEFSHGAPQLRVPAGLDFYRY